MQGIDQVCQLHPVDSTRVAIAGLSAGASMAALLVTLHPGRFKAVVMHSGIPPGTADSTLVTVSRLAHAWSGGAANKPFSDAKGPDASRMVWAFAARQFRV